MKARRWGIVLMMGAMLACGLDETGLLPDGGGLDASGDGPQVDGSMPDASNDAGSDVVDESFACADSGTVSCADSGGFGAPALYSGDAGAPCPSNYDTFDLASTTPDSPTCACSCTDAGAPSCDTTSVSYHLGTSNCTSVSGSLSLSGPCTTTSVTSTGAKLAVDTPALLGGCGGGTSTPPTATNTQVRLCVPQCASDTSVCTAQPGLRTCVFASGNVSSCPPGYTAGPFHVGNGPSVQCDPCTCASSGDCTGSQFHYYTSSSDCSSGDQSVKMDGTCNALPGSNGLSFQSAKIVGSLSGYKCTVTAGNAHASYASGEMTVCCK